MTAKWSLMRVSRGLSGRVLGLSLRKSQNCVQRREFWGTIKHIINPELDVERTCVWKHSSGDGAAVAVNKWQEFDDKALGGASELTVQNVEDGDGGGGGHLVIKGSLDLDEEKAEEMQVTGGYCAVKGLCSETMDLRDYEGLEMVLRSPHKELVFTMNMSTASLFDDDIYQVKMEIQPSTEWKSIEVPFSAFVLTSHGRIKEYQRANDSLQVESIGFLFKTEDGTESPFTLEIKQIDAMPSFDE